MSTHTSPFTKRFRKHLDEIPALMRRLTLKDAAAIQRAFVAALKEEAEARFPAVTYEDAVGQSLQRVMTPNIRKPLRIAGLGSFKMKTRPAREFWGPGNETASGTRKPPARRLAFTAKWEEIK